MWTQNVTAVTGWSWSNDPIDSEQSKWDKHFCEAFVTYFNESKVSDFSVLDLTLTLKVNEVKIRYFNDNNHDLDGQSNQVMAHMVSSFQWNYLYVNSLICILLICINKVFCNKLHIFLYNTHPWERMLQTGKSPSFMKFIRSGHLFIHLITIFISILKITLISI